SEAPRVHLCPARPNAWEAMTENWLKALLSTNSAHTDSSNNRRRCDSECRRRTRRAGTCHDGWAARHDQLTNAALVARFGESEEPRRLSSCSPCMSLRSDEYRQNRSHSPPSSPPVNAGPVLPSPCGRVHE